uniref:WD repeat-containing protein 43-like n=1 Tax=Rhizophora mucronata TaxID=61149 RepID=A0A2P2KI64_RHIMU
MGKDLESKAKVASNKSRKAKKKRPASDVDHATHTDFEAMDGILVEDNVNEPTMGEKLASLNLLEDQKAESHVKQESPSHANPPSADSVDILLKQALHADDHALLLDCLYTQDKKVIVNSISQLRTSDAIKLLHFLISIIQSRGAIVACALPWLKSLVLQHASGIMSQESSLVALNSLYQIIESRVSTFQSALQLSSCLDSHFAGVSF